MHGFELMKEQYISELHTTAKLFRHVKSGAELLSLENDDENKAFGVTFRTPPTDSTGLPHIMEHSVLCGSRKYPVKEPFVELIKGSLKTFLNAMTFPDKTSYPVASQNVKDLYHLIDVYLDAVFYPRLTPQIFAQEGWHYELERADQPMTFKGVVFNEMKGAYSSPDSLLERYSQQVLFPDTTYGVDSGGDPAEIPQLTYEQFIAFHRRYYHPSNACLFFYGDDDPAERLRFSNEYLQAFDWRDPAVNIALQPRFDEPKRLTFPYDAGNAPSGNKGMVTVNWLLTDTMDQELSLGFGILAHILIGTPASPLRKALIDSGLGEDLTGSGIDDHLRQMCFSTGLKGIAIKDAAKVEHLIAETLAALANNGIEAEIIEAALNTIEFDLRENNTGRFPRGLALLFHVLTVWLYGGDPLTALGYEAPLHAIKRKAAAGERYFETLLKTYLLDNPHRVSVILQPDEQIGQQQTAAETARLAAARAAMSDRDIAEIIERTQELKRLQSTPDSPEALATIPRLTLADLDRQNKLIPLEIQPKQDHTILYHDLFTNGIVYLDLGFDLHALPQDLVPYLPLFGKALVSIGTETEDYVKLSNRIGRKTGGVWHSFFHSAIQATSENAAYFFVRGKATMPQAADLLAILRDLLLTVKFDNRERFMQMALEAKARKESGLIPNGHAVAQTRLGAHFGETGWFAEQTGGVNSLFFTRRLAQDVEQNWSATLAKLEDIRRLLINRNGLICNVTLDQANWRDFEPQLSQLIAQIPMASEQPSIWTLPLFPQSEGLTIPAKVNYVAKGANLYDLGYTLHGSLLVIMNYLRTTWLWERVRVQGGAYGGFCGFDRQSGFFSYLSYRDPNLLKTLENYDQTAQFLRNAAIDNDELTKTIIGVIGQLDDYLLPDAKGYASLARHLTRDTEDIRQRIREEVLATTPADFAAFADVLDQVNRQGQVVVMGSPDAITQANAERDGWLNVVNVL